MKPVKAWAIVYQDELARIYASDHRWNIYDKRDAARINARTHGEHWFSPLHVIRVEIREVPKHKGKRK